jgi:hypothetical protein
MVEVLKGLREDLRQKRHTALLVALVIAFAVRPLIGNEGVAPVIFSLALVLLLLVSLYTIHIDALIGERHTLVAQRRRRTVVGWALAIVAIAERLIAFLSSDPRIFLIGTLTWMVFLAFVTVSILRTVLRQKAVTGETISMAISVYLLFGFTWGLLYAAMFDVHPEAFNLGAQFSTPTAKPDYADLLPTFVYFSLTTLSTIGFGDITPVGLQARYAAVAEAITGQFYLAILVARLVGLQMTQSGDHDR